ncbi:MAG: 2-C-methyl-D-erythritol 2,4-cyclodiphosphate synthase/2-C-methyl-D-erythritol 4-phosphate cytidylyltransferase [Candidatus Peregrinibacteria bacterium GW2011_GWF2_33_10]|nr:MAG: 2-C-methyl-D-erythritol 2,4-cyclodiphosphate synthase/2-C-methyl-D-erythritol 4-phosphate cytidylyltransferase [Candidatus Peregrinibacteria bacterium GW2011_GWF2_33_10]OGJ44617.1 MAG: hypothetical protein A2263_00020 [Candidatus Peregrinibacteria bacterium RIFOXYA2_FULL_33_21]OGJ46437.1 MAG: hypothetical protein A2272_06725 [Candidatus Peregrinibacteria bacterium RIFOXYA12_FULL_33_12]
MLYILLLAAGSSERFGKKSKIFADLAGKPVFLHSLEKFLKLKEEKKIILVVNRKEYRMWNMEYGMFLKENSIELVIGGVTRQTSVFKGFEYVSNQWLVVSSQYLIIHNCANPLVTEKEILDCMKMAKKCGVAGVGQKIDDTVRRNTPPQPPLKKGGVKSIIIDRKNLYLMQTPQIIRMDVFQKAYEFAKKTGFEGTDDLAVVENLKAMKNEKCKIKNEIQIKIVPASRQNFKITTKEDLEMAQKILNSKFLILNLQKIGFGEDAHWFENPPSLSRERGQGGELTLGGMKFKNYPKLQANSDGDVMIHSLCNALSSVLGGKSLGSFADKMCLSVETSLKLVSTDSKEFLKPLLIDLKKRKLQIQSVSFSLECLVPKIDEISDDLKNSLAKILQISKDKIGITATTGNKTTVFGKGKGVRCGCVVLVG